MNNELDRTNEMLRQLLKKERETKSENITLKAALYDIMVHSEHPFTGEKWLAHVHSIAKETLNKLKRGKTLGS